MKIEVTMTDAIFRRFTMFDLLRRRKMWRSPMLFAGILIASALVCFWMGHVDGAYFLGTTLLVVGLGIPFCYFLNFFLSLRKQSAVLGLKRPKVVYTLVLTEQPKGIHVSNETEEVDYAWKDVYHVYRDTTAIYLYMTPNRAFLLPNTSLEEIEPDDLWHLIVKMVAKDRCSIL